MTDAFLAELRTLIDATGLTYLQLASLLDANAKVVMSWYTGSRKPRHPAMLKRALQMVVLEQRGVISAKLIEQSLVCAATAKNTGNKET